MLYCSICLSSNSLLKFIYNFLNYLNNHFNGVALGNCCTNIERCNAFLKITLKSKFIPRVFKMNLACLFPMEYFHLVT